LLYSFSRDIIFKYNVEQRIEHIKKLKILPENIDHIIHFSEQQAAQGNSKCRQVKYISILGKIAEMVDYDFKNATKKEIEKLCGKINNSNLEDWTKHDYLLSIKVFYKFLRDSEEYPVEVKWIRPRRARGHKKLPRELLTIDDVKELAEHANNPRDRCLILMLYETGGRISEVLGLKIKDVEFDKYGALITFPDDGKTGARKVRVIACQPAITNWMRFHPKKENKDAFLLCGIWDYNRGEELNYRHVNDLLKEAGVKAGIKKPLNPHHFRHSRATELAKKLTEAQLCKYMGWAIGSREAATYVHLSGRDTDKAILEMYGIIEEEKAETKLKPVDCPRCGIRNDAAAKFCSGCSLGLDLTTVMEFEKSKKDVSTSIIDLIKDKEQALKTLAALTKLLQN
jgi:integrase/recombinase XerD